MPSVLLTFDTDPQRERFIEELYVLVEALSGSNGVNFQFKEGGWEERKEKGEFLAAAMKTLRRDPPIRGDDERMAAVYVSGQQMATGSIAALQERFMLPVANSWTIRWTCFGSISPTSTKFRARTGLLAMVRS